MQPIPENMSTSFVSQVTRDISNLIPKDIKMSPGPGTYDAEIQDKLKTLNFQLSTRYHLKPFGSGKTRFEYEQPPNNARANTIDFN